MNGPSAQTPRGPQAILALAVDALKLSDLQLQLLTLDVRDAWSAAERSIVVLAASTAALIAALPVAMFGIAEYLRQAASLSIEFALLLVSGVVLAAAGTMVALSARRLATAVQPLRRSADELRANLTWMRSVLYDDTADAGSSPMNSTGERREVAPSHS